MRMPALSGRNEVMPAAALPRNALDRHRASRIAGLILATALLFNAFLAFVNAHGMSIGETHVIAAEMIIVAVAGLFILGHVKLLMNTLVPILFILLVAFIFCWVSMFSGGLYLKSFRDMLLVVVFLMLGGFSTEEDLIRIFKFFCVVVLFFMGQEAIFTDSYARLFEPAMYYTSTRGYEPLSTDSTGLFRNSLGYSTRFSFGLADHRLSSVFLEQVSLANFSMVLALFTSAFWPRLKRSERILFFFTVVLCVLGTSSRTSSLVCLLVLVGHAIFPRLPKNSQIIYMPAFLLLGALFFYDPHLNVNETTDDVPGRVGHTINLLSTLDPSAIFLGDTRYINKTADTGYVYLIYTQTIVGMIVFWLFISLIVPARDAISKRFGHGMTLYIVLNLMVGAAIFSIKVSAPLWFIAGHLYQRAYLDRSDHV